MKIGIIVSSIYASPGLSQGRIFAPGELFTHLADGLVARGHTVTAFCARDVPTRAAIVPSTTDYLPDPPPYDKFRHQPEEKRTWLSYEYAKRRFELSTVVDAVVMAQRGELAILHSFHDSSLFLTHYLARLSRVPVVFSLHDPLPPPGSYEHGELTRFADDPFIAISESQKRSETLRLNFVGTVYHGVKLDEFPFVAAPSDGLLFMGRLVPEKGLHEAIAAAIATNIPLTIGTQFPKEHEENSYFDEKIKPFLDHPLISEPGLVGEREKATLYGQARALLFPIHWEEPFGMVMIEAMACGTPVIAYNRGSVPEIVKDGVTGFIVEDDDINTANTTNQTNTTNTTNKPINKWIIKKRGIEGLVEAVKRIGEIDRAACRRHVEENFTVEKMVTAYEAVYKKYGKSGE